LFPVCEVMLSVTQIRSVFVPTVSEVAFTVAVFVTLAVAVPVDAGLACTRWRRFFDPFGFSGM